MQILLVFPEKELLEPVAFALESKFRASVLRANSDKEGLQLLAEHQKTINLIILDGGEATLSAFALIIKLQSIKIPSVVCLQGEAKGQLSLDGLNVLGVADYNRLLADLETYVDNLQPKPPLPEETEEERKYSRIRTNLLVRLSPLDTGIFVRLSANHFVRLFQEGDEFNGEDLKRYQEQKKIDFMYLLNQHTDIFIQKLNAALVAIIQSKKINLRQAKELVEDAVDTIQELVNQIGITPEVQQLVVNNVAASMKVMGDFPELKAILNQMRVDKDKYIPSHSTMLAHTACAIAVSMDWYSDSTFQKLTMAAFLHDVALRNQELCAVKSLQDLEKNYMGKFSTRDVQEYKNHPKRGAQFAAQLKEAGAEVDKVILQHHEHPLGIGFPDAINVTYITPLSAVFIVAHDLVDYAFDHNGAINMEEFILENEKKLSAGNFKKVLKGLLQMAANTGAGG